METISVIPDPISLLASMRAVGYTVEAAIADLVDNSISASANRVEIKYDASSAPFIAILDNGTGMSGDELTNAMRHGSRNPSAQRDPNDLGRFGLGLKTASLSQCRKMTVVSKKDGVVSARCWDLEVVRVEVAWVVVVPDQDVLGALPMFNSLSESKCGTLVVWQELDRLVAGSISPQQEMTNKLAPLYDHLALVFHRFSSKEDGQSPVEIFLNGLKVPPRDPFLKANHFRQPLEGQTIRHPNGVVSVLPYILPPVSHLNPEEIELAGGREGLRGSQGFYVYRNRRLVIWGTWFKLVPKDEFYKLTRVQVDIPNTFDDLWALDIKKSAAYPPEAIRYRLKELIPHFANISRKTVTYPGRKSIQKDFTPMWVRIEPSYGKFRYELNTEHPAVQSMSSRLSGEDQSLLQALLNIVVGTVPFESIYADMSADQRGADEEAAVTSLIEIAESLISITGRTVTEVLKIDPLARYPQFHERIAKDLVE